MKIVDFTRQKIVTFLQKAQEGDMSLIECQQCSQRFTISTGGLREHQEFVFLGTMTHIDHGKHNKEEHPFPFKFAAGRGRGGDIVILPPPHAVDALGAKVESAENKTVEAILKDERPDLVQDIEEARDAKLWELYKASVVMCRRIVQIPLTEILQATGKDKVEAAINKANDKRLKNYDGLSTLTLGPLLTIERNLESRSLSDLQREQAKRIKDAGDDGAHNKVELEPDSVDGIIREAAIIAASLVYQMPSMKISALQLEKGSNEQ